MGGLDLSNKAIISDPECHFNYKTFTLEHFAHISLNMLNDK